MSNIDFNALFEAAVKQREEANKQAEEKYTEEVNDLLKSIVLKVSAVADVEGDVRPGLQRILDGQSASVPTAPSLEPDEKKQLELEIQQLKTDKGRVEADLQQAQDDLRSAKADLANAERELTRRPVAKKATAPVVAPPPPASTVTVPAPQDTPAAEPEVKKDEDVPKPANQPKRWQDRANQVKAVWNNTNN